MSLLQELSQRNVYQTIGGYLAMGWFLLKSGEVVFPLFGLPLWSFRALVLFLVAAFPIVTFVAWRYRITPEGLAGHELPEDREEAPVLQRSRRFENWIVLALVAVAIVATVVSAGLKQSGGAAPRSVAVLPFVNMSGDIEQEYFADGLTEELLNVLAKVPDLQVAGRTSSFAFKGRNEDLREIGKQLNVRVLLEGSVRRDGENLRVTAQLIDVASGYHLFSETYDRHLDDVFRIQDDIARRVVQEIKYELLEQDSGTFVATGPDPAAYENYLRSRRAVSQRLLGELPGAIASLEEMLELEPDFARGWSALADAYAVASQYGVVAKEDAEGPLEAAARRALELDPALSEAHVSMGMMEALRGESPEQVLRHFREAVRLNPNNPEAHLWLAISLPRTNGGDVRAVLEKAYALDPLHPIIGYRYVVALAMTGNTDRAWQVVQGMRTTGNAASSYLKVSAMLHYLTGDVAGAALASLEDLERNPGDVFSLGGLAYYGAVLGFYEEVEELLAQGLSAYPDYVHLRVEQIRLLSDPGAKRAISADKDIVVLSKKSDRESGYFLGSIYASRGQCAKICR